MNATWSDILLKLRQSLPEGVCKVWLEPLAGEIEEVRAPASATLPGSSSGPEEEGAPLPGSGASPRWNLELRAPNAFVAGWVRDRLTQPIVQAASDLLGEKVSLTVEARSCPRAPVLPEPLTSETLARSLPTTPVVLASTTPLSLPVRMPRPEDKPLSFQAWRYSFEDFVVGPCNQLAHAAACNMLQSSLPVDMLFLCSDPGLGKTHLAQAVGRALCLEGDRRNVRVAYLTAEEFTSRFVHASRFGAMDDFRERFRGLDMLLLEDVHFLRGKDRTQEELLATIKALQSSGGRVVLTSSFAPRELSGVDSQLVSRFCSGFVAAMDRPGKDTRLHILMEKARRQSVILPSEVADMLAERVTHDVRVLESCLHNLVLKARLAGSPVTEAMALEVIHSVAQRYASLSLDDVVDMVCRSFHLTPAQLSSRSRRQELVVARNTAFFLLRKHTGMTLEEIGGRFNRRHSTVLKGITALEREMSRQSPLGRQIAHTVSLIEKNSVRA